MFRTRTTVIVAGLAGLALRVAWPLADPAADLSWSGGVLTDPPANTLPARFAIEYGDWTRVPIAERLVYPLLNAVAWLGYSAFGPTRLATQLLAAAIGIATVLALGGALRRSGPGAAATGVVLGSLAYWIGMYSRVLMAENLVTLMLVVAALLALRPDRTSHAAAGALAVAAALFGKALAAAFLPGLALFLVLRSRRVATLGPPAAAGAAVAAVWLAAVFLPHRAELIEWASRSSLGQTSITFAGWLIRSPIAPFEMVREAWMFHQMPVIASVGLWFAVVTVSHRGTLRKRLNDGSALFALWFLGACVAYALLPYRAPRYFVLIAFPLVACAAAQLAEMVRRLADEPPRPAFLPRLLFLLLVSFGLLDLARHWERRVGEAFLLESFSRVGDTLEAFPAHVAASVGIAAVLFTVTLALRRVRPHPWPRRTIGVSLLAVAVSVNLAQWARWTGSRSYTIEHAKESLAAIVGPSAVLIGGFAPLLAQGSGRLAVPQFGGWSGARPLTDHGATHVLLTGAIDRAEFDARFPDLGPRARLVQRWPVRGAWVSGVELLRLPPAAEAAYPPTELEWAIDARREEDWSGALELFEGLPRLPDVLAFEADCLYQLGRADEARSRLLRAIALRPHDPALHTNLGTLAFRNGDLPAARAHWRRALRIEPGHRELRELLRRATP
jgi:hypothetical protein